MQDQEQTEVVVFFATPAAFEAWMEEHHASTNELWVGYYKKDSGQSSITWPESVDVALCFGWIDGLRRSIDDRCYRIRFTPRKPRSNWSAVNVARVVALTAEGRMRPEGLEAYARRRDEPTAGDSEELPKDVTLDAASAAQFRANAVAWAAFIARPPSFRRMVIRWVMSAKKRETRQRRLAALIADLAAPRTNKELPPPSNLEPADETRPG